MDVRPNTGSLGDLGRLTEITCLPSSEKVLRFHNGKFYVGPKSPKLTTFLRTCSKVLGYLGVTALKNQTLKYINKLDEINRREQMQAVMQLETALCISLNSRNIRVADAQRYIGPPPEELGLNSLQQPQVNTRRSQVLTANKLDDILPHVRQGEKTLVCLDVDDMLVSRDVMPDGSQSRVAVHPDTRGVIRRIREKAPDARIVLLTKGDEAATRAKLREGGITDNLDELFDGAIILDTDIPADKNKNKGDKLKEYLDSTGFQTQHVCFMDDLPEFHEHVQAACAQLNLSCTSFVFTGSQDMQDRVGAANSGLTVPLYRAYQREGREIDLRALAERYRPDGL